MTTTPNTTASGAADRYTKKPVTIDAIRWTGKNLREVIAFTDGPPDTRTSHAGMAWDTYVDLVERDGLKIFTLEGKMSAAIGDWIIKGVQGEMYPCKDEIFRLTYEPVVARETGSALRDEGIASAAPVAPVAPAPQPAAPKKKPLPDLMMAAYHEAIGWNACVDAMNVAAAPKAAPGDALDEAMRERDDAEDFINELLDEVLGVDRPEWSSAYNRYDAMNDVRERITALHKPAADKAWGRFGSATAEPKQEAQEPVASVHRDTLAMLNSGQVRPWDGGARLHPPSKARFDTAYAPLYAAPPTAPADRIDLHQALTEPVAWLVYMPSEDAQRIYDSQDDIGYVDDLTNHADAEVIPLYPGTAPKAEVEPAGE